MPERVRDQVRLEAVTKGTTITIVERRAPWRADYGPEWSSHPVARLTYGLGTKRWKLFWADRRGRWHTYPEAGPSPDLQTLLDEIDRDPSGIFWG